MAAAAASATRVPKAESLTRLEQLVGEIVDLRAVLAEQLDTRVLPVQPSKYAALKTRLDALAVDEQVLRFQLETLQKELSVTSHLKLPAGAEAPNDANKDAHQNFGGLSLKTFPSLGAISPVYIKSLCLSHNQFTAVPPECIELIKLEVLDISHNAIKALPSWLSRLGELRIVLFGHNQIAQVDASWVGPQSKLKVVNLQNNLLTAGSLMAVVRHPLKLNALSLASNSLTTLPSWIVEHCGTLERLYLDGNGLSELPDNLATLRSLRYLTLDGNQLRHVQPATLLPNLIGLGVSHNRITVKPDFQQSIQVLRVDGNPWLHDDETANAETSTVAS